MGIALITEQENNWCMNHHLPLCMEYTFYYGVVRSTTKYNYRVVVSDSDTVTTGASHGSLD